MSILVTHPGRQHSHQLARALRARDALAGYWTGVPAADPGTKGPIYQALAARSPQPTLDLPNALVRHNYVMPIVRRVAERVFSPGTATAICHRAAAWFDTWAARRLPSGLDAVVCYENGARDTFRAAKGNGLTTILDAASFHHAWQDDVFEPVESDAAHQRINRRKEEEIALADHILTVSELARESYVNAGVPEEKVTSVPMGAELDDFAPPSPLRKPGSEPFTFLFVGHAGERKGADVLIKSSRVLREADIEHRVRFAGGADKGTFACAPSTVEHLGYLDRDALVQAMHGADVLVLPSRHDSFGRVIVEGMATGLPALVSENVGAKEVLTEGKNGWVVPAENADALAERMRWCTKHRQAVAGMQEPAASAAREYTWSAYRTRVVNVLKRVIENSNSAA